MMKDNIPIHVSIIMDGNGRWAKSHGKERLAGHAEGVESVRDCCEYAAQVGIKYLSLFAFSEENWSRPDNEVAGLMAIMAHSVLAEKSTFSKNHIRFMVIGDRSRLDADLLAEIDQAMEDTKDNTGLTLVVFLSYSGKWDIMQAAERYAMDCATIGKCRGLTYDSLAKYLSTADIPDPDLLIRTSGEQRISNFMLWQCAYTEFYFTDVLWPDFRRTNLQIALDDYSSRQRRFGKTGEQLEDK